MVYIIKLIWELLPTFNNSTPYQRAKIFWLCRGQVKWAKDRRHRVKSCVKSCDLEINDTIRTTPRELVVVRNLF